VSGGHRSLPALSGAIVRCGACPRLVAWREKVARERVARFRHLTYWGRPVPGFGDPRARILIVGLAPGAHGANRTGRKFTGDRSGDFLYAALHRAGLASQPASFAADDGMALRGAYIVSAIRCAPPANSPRPGELLSCAHFLDDEIALLPDVQVVLALGAIAWRAYLGHLARAGAPLARPLPKFAHGRSFELPTGPGPMPRTLLGSFHVSQQNTQTGRLTAAMFDEVLARATTCADLRAPRARALPHPRDQR
jgi:uracil-DNA glycosylase family 4